MVHDTTALTVATSDLPELYAVLQDASNRLQEDEEDAAPLALTLLIAEIEKHL